jgi:RNA-directed DNA polymerase
VSLKDDKQQNIQMELDFSSALTGEAREAGREETESSGVTNGPENPASTNRLMEEVCERENLKEALRRVKANKGSAGVDGMTVVGVTDYLKQHWPAIREQLLNGTYEPKPVRRVEIAKPDGGVRKLGIPTVLDRFHPASGDAGSAEAVGPDIFRSQLRVPAGTVGSSSGGTGAAVYRRRPRLVR